MVLVYFFYTIIFAIILFMIFIILSTIKIRIENLLMTNMSEIAQKQQPNYHITFSLYLFNRVKWFSISINRLKMQKLYSKIQLDKIDIKKIEKDFSFQDLKLLKKIKLFENMRHDILHEKNCQEVYAYILDIIEKN